jgi:hypothetical protein
LSERTRTFSGKTVEEAIQRATTQLGDNAVIVEARRVRRGGFFGFFAKEQIEVTGRQSEAPPARPLMGHNPDLLRGPEATFADHLSRLVEEVDIAEEVVRMETRPQVRPARRFTDDDLQPLPPDGNLPRPRRAPAAPKKRRAPVAAPAVATAAPAVRPNPVPARAAMAPAATRPIAPAARSMPPAAATIAPAMASAMARAVAASPRPARSPLPATAPLRVGTLATLDESDALIDLRATDGPTWSLDRLETLGLPEVLLDALAQQPLVDDISWIVALERGINQLFAREPRHNASVHGHDLASVFFLLQAASMGVAVADLQIGDRLIPATPLELALAVRACLDR